MKDRRQYPRYVIKLPVHFRKLDARPEETKKPGKYWTEDVSLGGMRFASNHKLALDTNLAIELHLPKDSFSEFVTQDPIQIHGRVAWSGQKQDESVTYDIGVEFVSLLESDQKRIEECIQFFLHQGERDH